VEEHLRFTSLFLPSLPAFLRLAGDGGFSPEQMLGYEAGYRSSLRPFLFVDFAAFYNDYADLLSVEADNPFVESDSDAPAFRVSLPVLLRNGLEGETAGAEIATIWSPTPWWRLKGSYALLRINLTNKSGSIDGSTAVSTEGSSPEHQVVVQSLLDLPANLSLDGVYRYASALPALSVQAYSTADVRLGWRVAEFELSLVGKNLLQAHHAEFAGNPGPPVGIKRGLFARLTWNRDSR
jgi:iron complex outermembrane receptor protein